MEALALVGEVENLAGMEILLALNDEMCIRDRVCTGFEILPDGEGTSYWIREKCGALAMRNENGAWVLPEAKGDWFPAGENLLQTYLDALAAPWKK